MPRVLSRMVLPLLLVLAAAPAAQAATPKVKLYACVTKSYKTLNLTTASAKCAPGETKVSWSVEGPAGPKGAKGHDGKDGKNGKDGATGPAGAKGDKGDAGAKGDTGTNGAAGATGTAGATGAAGTPADLSAYQQRVTGVCAPGSFLASVAVDGTVGCTSPVLPLTLTDAAAGAIGLSVGLTNALNGNPALSASNSGGGEAIHGDAAGGVAIHGVTHSISAAGVIGDNARGEGVVARVGGGCTDTVALNCAGIGGVVGRNDGPGGYGVRGFSTSAGTAFQGIGVLGQAGVSGGRGAAIRGENVNASNPSNAVEAVTNGAGSALFATGTQAGTFNGAVTINGDLTVTGTKSGFHIDDPRSPTTRTLTHTPLETDALMVQYTGNARTDAHGRATVKLPAYAETLAGDWRYQLTPVGTFDEVIVAGEVRDGAFVIRSRKAGTKVSWTVTGVRHDPQAESDAIAAVKAKTGADRGRYLDPSLYGAPKSLGPVGVKPVGTAGVAKAATAGARRGLASSR